ESDRARDLGGLGRDAPGSLFGHGVNDGCVLLLAVSVRKRCADEQRGGQQDRKSHFVSFHFLQWPAWPEGLRTVTSISPGAPCGEAACGARTGSATASLTSRATVPGGCLYQPGSE